MAGLASAVTRQLGPTGSPPAGPTERENPSMALIVRLMCFPASDAAFVDLANEALGTAETPVAMAEALRRMYPSIVVRKQDPIASFDPGGERWYAYREGRVMSQPADSWWDDAGLARVGIDQTNTYSPYTEHTV